MASFSIPVPLLTLASLFATRSLAPNCHLSRFIYQMSLLESVFGIAPICRISRCRLSQGWGLGVTIWRSEYFSIAS